MKGPTPEIAVAILALYLLGALPAGLMASRSGQSGLGGFLVSPLFTPLPGLLAALATPRHDDR